MFSADVVTGKKNGEMIASGSPVQCFGTAQVAFTYTSLPQRISLQILHEFISWENLLGLGSV